MKESVTETVTRLISEQFTGQITIHMMNGVVKEVVEQKRWRPAREDQEIVDITEARKRP